MNFLHDHFHIPGPGTGGYNSNGNNNPSGHKIDINPGQVEEAVHYMAFNGAIDMSELHFQAFPNDYSLSSSSSFSPAANPWGGGSPLYSSRPVYNQTVKESFLDIAVFEVPDRCTSRTCDLSRFGVGKLEQFSGASFLNLCHDGRLYLDTDLYQGFHTQLMVPREGSMPHSLRHGKVNVPVPNKNYEVMIANCNDLGRRVRLNGQVIFDFDDSPASQMDAISLSVLTSVALAVCCLFSACSIRIRWGRNAGGDYMVVDEDEDDDGNDDAVEQQGDGNTNESGSYSDSRNGRDNTGSTDRNDSFSSSRDYDGDGIELEEFDDEPTDEEDHDLRLHTVSIV